MSEEAIRLYAKHGATGSVAVRAAREQGRRHLFMDPNTEQRRTEGITSDDQREAYWLKQLQRSGATSCICAIGQTHVESFGALLDAHGIQRQVLVRNFCYR